MTKEGSFDHFRVKMGLLDSAGRQAVYQKNLMLKYAVAVCCLIMLVLLNLQVHTWKVCLGLSIFHTSIMEEN